MARAVRITRQSLIVVQQLPSQALASSMVVTGEHFMLGAARVRPSSLRGISPEVPTATWLCVQSLWCQGYKF